MEAAEEDEMKSSWLTTIAALAVLAFSVPSSAADLELLQPGKLQVATEGTYPPFSMRSPDGQLDGLEIRVMKEVARRLGLEYTPVLIKWDSLLVGLMADQYDVISAAKKIKAAEVKGKPVKATTIENWQELRTMGVVKEEDGTLVLTFHDCGLDATASALLGVYEAVILEA